MAKRQKKKEVAAEQIKIAYEGYTIRYGTIPNDLVSFCSISNIPEEDFEKHYGSLKILHMDIWKSYIVDTINALAEDEQYGSFTVREQLLAFYYTHLEVLKSHREFIQVVNDEFKRPLPLPSFLKGYKEAFVDYGKQLIQAGLRTGEIADRKMLNRSYTNGLWAQLLFVVKFWLKDSSENLEKTDAAIEKAVSLSFELVRPGPIDSFVDFAKFIYQNRK
ncbi:MAG: TetR/AcrR family transcriptional regulator [Bacteroidia bacterium]|nr:TetR/AcrR family transcriptional regulator [Bacteroidia bacterium]